MCTLGGGTVVAAGVAYMNVEDAPVAAVSEVFEQSRQAEDKSVSDLISVKQAPSSGPTPRPEEPAETVSLGLQPAAEPRPVPAPAVIPTPTPVARPEPVARPAPRPVAAPAVPAPKPRATPAPRPSVTPLLVDGVAFDPAHAERALAWLNSAEEAEIRAAGVYGRGVGIILDQRPFASLEAFGATPYVGEKTVAAVAAASR